MAIELFSGNCVGDPISPRISFSYDFSHSSVIPVEHHSLSSTSDFDFCVRQSSDQESSSADELFAGGRILPTEIKTKKKKNIQTDQKLQITIPHSSPLPEGVRQNASTKSTSESKKEEAEEKQGHHHNTKSFWGFKRSSSCGSSNGYRRSLCPLPLLSRSYSTGSYTSSVNNKRNMTTTLSSKEAKNAHKLHTSSSSVRTSSSSSSSQYSFGANSYYQKPPLKKFQGSYGGVRVNSPVILNVPSANLFGLGSIFSKNRDKTKRK